MIPPQAHTQSPERAQDISPGSSAKRDYPGYKAPEFPALNVPLGGTLRVPSDGTSTIPSRQPNGCAFTRPKATQAQPSLAKAFPGKKRLFIFYGPPQIKPNQPALLSGASVKAR